MKPHLEQTLAHYAPRDWESYTDPDRLWKAVFKAATDAGEGALIASHLAGCLRARWLDARGW